MTALSVVSHLDFATAIVKNPEVAGRVLTGVEHLFHRYPRIRYWSFLGLYRGRIATSDEKGGGGIASGRAADGAGIVQSWGKETEVMVQIVLGVTQVHFTRLDMAVTVLFSQPQPCVRELLATLPADKHNYTIIQPANDEGGTLYIGSRRSDVFARLYDKGAELRTLPGRLLWRYEVELKHRHAERAVAQLFVDSVLPSDRLVCIFENVRHYFTVHAVPFPDVPDAAKQYPVVQYESRVTDDATTLRWFRTQVYPALMRLDGNGKLDQALEALQIDRLGQPLRRFNLGEVDAVQGHFLDKMQHPMYD